jgi:hypothetical protein
MSRTLICLFAAGALACGTPQPEAQAPAPQPQAPAPAPEAAPPAAPAAAAGPEAPPFEGDHAMAKTEASRAVLAWLPLVDAGKLGEAWDAGAGNLQDATPKEAFTEAVGTARSPLGALQARNFARAEYTKELPGAPEGEYVLVGYQSAFENKAEGQETVIATLDWDGSWKVVGYDVR